MIRINLLPAKKKKKFAPKGSPQAGQWWVLGMIAGLVAVIGVEYWVLADKEAQTEQLNRQVADVRKQVEKIKKETDEEGLKSREEQLRQMQAAIAKLTAKRRTPAFVMYELAMILSPAEEGGGPDVDFEKHRQLLKADPHSQINPRWDPSGLWIDVLSESGGILALEGSSRDAADLSEFTRRLRASAWFGDLTHADFQRIADRDDTARHLNWKLQVGVRRWE